MTTTYNALDLRADRLRTRPHRRVIQFLRSGRARVTR